VQAIKRAEAGVRPWSGKNVYLLMATGHTHREAFKQILEAAGAKLLQNISRDFRPDFCLVCEVTQEKRPKSYQVCLKAGFLCYDARYLLDSIFAPKADPADFLVA